MHNRCVEQAVVIVIKSYFVLQRVNLRNTEMHLWGHFHTTVFQPHSQFVATVIGCLSLGLSSVHK